MRLYSIYNFLITIQISNGYSRDVIAYVLCSRSVYRAPTTLFSRTSGAWVCPWWKWPLDASLSHRLMLRNWNRFLASQWKGRQPLASPPQSHGLLGDQAAVSLRCDTVCPAILLLFFFFYYSSLEWNNFKRSVETAYHKKSVHESIGDLEWWLVHRTQWIMTEADFFFFPPSIRTWQQTTDGYFWAAWLHSEWSECACILVYIAVMPLPAF